MLFCISGDGVPTPTQNDKIAMFRYLAKIAQMEGAFVIIPSNGVVEGIPENLRRVRCEVYNPANRHRNEFAERGNRGSWMLVWMPPD